MILRRFTQHINEQNWFAVGLDVLVVIVGILLGLQVQQIIEERQRQDSEHLYLERLHNEVVQLALDRSFYDRTRVSNAAYLKEAIQMLQNPGEKLAELFD